MNFSSLLKRPSAFVPLILSVAALATVVIHVLVAGTHREADEGAAAHIFQLFIIAEAPLVAFFAITWVPRAHRPALLVLALQFGAALAAFAPVFILKL